MLSTGVCPDIAQYKQLATGELSAPDKEALLDHLEACPVCVQRMESFSEKNTLVDLIRKARTLDDGLPGSAVARLVEQLRELRPSGEAVGRDSAQIRLACSGCGKSLRVKAGLAGKKVKCPHCQTVLVVPNAPSLPAGEPSGSSASAVADGLTVAPSNPPAGGRSSAGTAIDPAAGWSEPASIDRHLFEFLAPAQAPDELGRLGTYRVLKVLGSGGMGVVFQAEDPDLQRLVALKAMLPSLAASESAKQRFLREARAAAALKHDHIVTIHQVGEDRGAPYLAMEFLQGEPLDDRLKREGKLPLADVLRIGREMAEGLAAAHERGLIHRDIKPANVWLEARGVGQAFQPDATRKSQAGKPDLPARVKILDFGLARAATGEAHLTQPGAIVGTPAYMAPEQGQGKAVDPRSDLFSLGCVLYRMATGEAPFRGIDMISTLMAVATEKPASPRSLNNELPKSLSDFIMRLLAKKPEHRPESAHVVAEILERIARETPSPKKPTTHRNGRRIAVAVLALALLAPLAYWLGGVIVRMRTPDGGILIVEVSEADAEVFMDGKQVTVTWDEDGKKAQITIKPGKHKVEVKKAGFTVYGDLVEVTDGTRTVLTARLERPPQPQPIKGPEVKGPDVKGPEPAPKETARQLWVEAHGYFIQGVGKDWFQKWADGNQPPNLFHEVQRTTDFVELRHYLVPVIFQLYKDKSLMNDERLKAGFKPGSAGQWQKDPAAADPSRQLWVEAQGYFIRGPGNDWLQKWANGKQPPNLMREVQRTPDFVELRHYGVPVTFRLYKDKSFMNDERLKAGLRPGAAGQWQVHPHQTGSPPVKEVPPTVNDEAGIAKLKQLLLNSTWHYHDNLYPPGDTFRFNADGTFHVWKWNYWVVGPREVRVHYDRGNHNKETGIPFIFNPELTRFTGEFTDPNKRLHKITGSLLPPPMATEEQLRQRVETAWPGLGNNLSRDKEGNYHLNLRMCGQVADLTPLKGMPLTTLNIAYCNDVVDLAPLQGMKLKSLALGRCKKLKDLRPLQGMELDFLDLAQCNDLDLTHLKGMKIKLISLWNRGANDHLRSLQGVQVNGLILSFSHFDLTLLKGMALNELVMDHCGGFSDLTPLKDLPLVKLNIQACDQITDISALQDTPLQEILIDFKPARDAKILRAIKSLVKINNTPVDQFWKGQDPSPAKTGFAPPPPASKELEARVVNIRCPSGSES